jgi:hypothetical protein
MSGAQIAKRWAGPRGKGRTRRRFRSEVVIRRDLLRLEQQAFLAGYGGAGALPAAVVGMPMA